MTTTKTLLPPLLLTLLFSYESLLMTKTAKTPIPSLLIHYRHRNDAFAHFWQTEM